jgi:hypothetical protein
MWRKLAFIAIILISFLIPLLTYCSEKNPQAHEYTLAFPVAENSPCAPYCKSSYSVTHTDNGKAITTSVVCGVRTDETGFGMAGHSMVLEKRRYCIQRTIIRKEGRDSIEEIIIKELEN